ncbi:unnamed protein product [Clonostachys solani]|uniref:Secreted protein n=1 Tax=Clonostachys solani TaxID=160281 RepID=A0A9N9Z9H3_9HYPO|nr:unnamed protein product [Clonostachys solani]
MALLTLALPAAMIQCYPHGMGRRFLLACPHGPYSISGKEDSAVLIVSGESLSTRGGECALCQHMITVRSRAQRKETKTRNHGMLSKVVFYSTWSPVVRQRDPLSVVEIQWIALM